MLIRELSGKLVDMPLWKEQIEARRYLSELNSRHWLEYNVFTPVWWFMLFSFIAAWFIWWKLVKKEKLLEITCYGLMITLVSTILDVTGAQFVLWGYPNMLFPAVPPLFFVDLCMIPIIYMLVYQYFYRWIPFLIAMTVTSFCISFIGEPVAVYLEIYQLNTWKYIYSFPIYIALAALFKLLCSLIIRRQEKSRK